MNRLFAFSVVLVTMVGCSKPVSKDEARAWLVKPEAWLLKQVTVNQKPVFKDGEVIEQFGEVSFSRYMEAVSFTEDGRFSGKFKGDHRLVSFQWVSGEDAVLVRDTVPNSGEWVIPYRTLTEESFEMETETTAFDPPNRTKIKLYFGR
jgi:hypothetical protein